MKRVKGTAGVSLFECINADLNKWNVRWDVQENPETDEARQTVLTIWKKHSCLSRI